MELEEKNEKEFAKTHLDEPQKEHSLNMHSK